MIEGELAEQGCHVFALDGMNESGLDVGSFPLAAPARLGIRAPQVRVGRVDADEWCFLPGLTLELTGHRREDGLARAEKMYRVPQPGPRQPAVGGPVVQRRVRRR